MADPKLPYIVLDNFAQHDPSERDIRNVMEALRSIGEHPDEGTLVPFESDLLTDCFVVWTSDRKYRILYHYHNPADPQILSIEPEEE